MIIEIALLYIKKNKENLFERAFEKAQKIISKMNGYISHELLKCMEEENKYALLVRWNTVEDHIEGFRKNEEYTDWKNLLHHFYNPFPVVEHYQKIY
ncbi:MAG: antibiotic biosynthesis monooxygenase [Bacteroidota bacterium]|nr:antibiotic biosynthesis monooxygenase [Bacteroidota bacterium]